MVFSRRLEESLGAQLFERDEVRLRLGDAGQRLLPQAQRLTDMADSVHQQFNPRRALVEIRIAAPAVLQWMFADVLGASLTEAEGIAGLRLEDYPEEQALREVVEGRADVAIASAEGLEMLDAGETVRRQVGELRMILASAPGSAPEALACTLVSPLCGQPRAQQNPAWFKTHGLPAPALRASDLMVVVELVRQGRTRAFLPGFLVDRDPLETDPAAVSPVEQIWAVCRTEAALPVKHLLARLAG